QITRLHNYSIPGGLAETQQQAPQSHHCVFALQVLAQKAQRAGERIHLCHAVKAVSLPRIGLDLVLRAQSLQQFFYFVSFSHRHHRIRFTVQQQGRGHPLAYGDDLRWHATHQAHHGRNALVLRSDGEGEKPAQRDPHQSNCPGIGLGMPLGKADSVDYHGHPSLKMSANSRKRGIRGPRGIEIMNKEDDVAQIRQLLRVSTNKRTHRPRRAMDDQQCRKLSSPMRLVDHNLNILVAGFVRNHCLLDARPPGQDTETAAPKSPFPENREEIQGKDPNPHECSLSVQKSQFSSNAEERNREKTGKLSISASDPYQHCIELQSKKGFRKLTGKEQGQFVFTALPSSGQWLVQEREKLPFYLLAGSDYGYAL